VSAKTHLCPLRIKLPLVIGLPVPTRRAQTPGPASAPKRSTFHFSVPLYCHVSSARCRSIRALLQSTPSSPTSPPTAPPLQSGNDQNDRNDKKAEDERTRQPARPYSLTPAHLLHQNPALDTGSPATAGQTHEPPVQHLAAPFFNRSFSCTVPETRSGEAGARLTWGQKCTTWISGLSY
jgi:hypothetical protein